MQLHHYNIMYNVLHSQCNEYNRMDYSLNSYILYKLK